MNDALLRTARSLHQAGRLSEATRLYRQILDADPQHFDALVMLGVALLESGQREDANAIADDGINTAESSRDLYNLGYLLERLERSNDALLGYNAALAERGLPGTA
jgi:tetratricopeptide (TPR) repeat protein